MKPLRSDQLAAWSRTFAVQGSWNYRTLVGTGIAYAMLPLLRRIYAGDPERLREALLRNMGPFNGHPYLCAMAVAALGRLEMDDADPQTMEKFRAALRGPLGTVGDRAVWGQWRPACLLVAIVAYFLGAGPTWAVLIFLGLYNVGHIGVRSWAYVTGWEAGLGVGKLLKGSWLERWSRHLWPLNIALLGTVATLVGHYLVQGAPLSSSGPVLIAIGVVTGLVAFRFPRLGGRLAGILLVAAPVLWLLGALIG